MTRIVPVVAIAIAGIIHLVLAPAHFEHAPAHGIFFALAGVGEVLWAILFWRRPSQVLYYAGFILVGGLVSLWAITRVVPGPFEHEPGAIDLEGLACKTSELAGILALMVLAVQGGLVGATRRPGIRVAGDALAFAILGGLAFFMIGRAAEPLLPSLASTEEHADGESAPGHGIEEDEAAGHDDPGDDHAAVPAGEAVIIGDLKIEGIWSRSASTGATAAIYLSVTNTGHEADRLVGARTDAASVTELHQSITEDGIIRMVPVEGGLELPPGANVKLELGGYHFILVDLQQDLLEGEHYQAILQFEKAGEVIVEVEVGNR